MSSRIPALESALQMRSGDPFLLYALGVEHMNDGALEKSRSYFEQVREQHPNYVPLYFQYGNLLERSELATEARRMYEQGIRVATGASDHHAAAELEAALAAM